MIILRVINDLIDWLFPYTPKNAVLRVYSDGYNYTLILSSEGRKIWRINDVHFGCGISAWFYHPDRKFIDEKGRPYQPVYAQPILSYRLDDLVRQFALQPANHIKLDVDGGELNVLCGAGETLTQRTLRSLLVEVDEERYPNGEITSFLLEKGFRIKSRHQRGRRDHHVGTRCL